MTGDATARVQTPTGERATQKVEPLADYFVGRLKKDFMSGNLVVGGVASGVTRRLDDTFAPRLAKHAEMYGNDVFYTWHEQMFSFQAQAAVTNVSGDPREILLREQSSARYFQRPDRGAGSGGFLSNRLDSNATSLRGAGAYARIAKNTGNWFGEVQTNTRTPGYETNDYAFQQRADYLWFGANVGRIWTKPTKWYRDIVTIAGTQTQNNYEGDNNQRQFHYYWAETTPQFWNVTFFYINRPSVMDDPGAARRSGDQDGAGALPRDGHVHRLAVEADRQLGRERLLGRKERVQHLLLRERHLPARLEPQRVVRAIALDGAGLRAVRPGGRRHDGEDVLREAVRDVERSISARSASTHA